MGSAYINVNSYKQVSIMKILIAGATGALGKPLVDLLVQDGHEIYGVTQSKENALLLAGKGAITNRVSYIVSSKN